VETLFESKGGFVHFGNIEVDGVVKTTIFDPVRSTYTVGSAPPSFLRFLELGFVHVAIGLDHVLFLLGLIVCATRFKDLLGLATTFTIAHATTIVVSALGWFTIAPEVIEPAIALTIVAIGLEARRESVRYPTYLIVAGLGLIHGFGFSYALRDVGLPVGDEALALLGFNLGVEAAQIVFVTVIAGLLAIPVWREKITQNHRKWVGRAISLIGLIWFGMRLLG
jgi:hydrogenase/urease accessory protein HupE